MAKQARSTGYPTYWTTGALFLGTLAIFIFTANRSLTVYANDVLYTARPAWTLAFAGNLNLEGFNDIVGFKNWTIFFDGHTRSDRFPGAILMASIVYFISQSSGYFSMVPAAVTAALASALTVLLLHRMLLTIATRKVALASCLLFAFGTSVWSVASDALWSEGPTMLGLAFGAWALSRQSWFLAGLGYGFALLSRPHAVVVGAISGLWESVTRKSKIPALKVGSTTALGLLALLLWNKVNAGQWTLLPGSYDGRIEGAVSPQSQARGIEWLSDYSATFFSPLRGLFVYSPFLLLLLPGLPAAWRTAPSWVRSTAIGGVVYLVVQLAGNSWFGGGGIFGNRLIIPAMLAWWPLMTLAYSQWLERFKPMRWAFMVLGALAIWWTAFGALLFRSKYFEDNPDQFFYWWNWTAGLYISWAWPLGWLAAAAFVGALGYAVYYEDKRTVVVVPTEAPRTKKKKKKSAKGTQAKSGSK
jgi:hypothetical protein